MFLVKFYPRFLDKNFLPATNLPYCEQGNLGVEGGRQNSNKEFHTKTNTKFGGSESEFVKTYFTPIFQKFETPSPPPSLPIAWEKVGNIGVVFIWIASPEYDYKHKNMIFGDVRLVGSYFELCNKIYVFVFSAGRCWIKKVVRCYMKNGKSFFISLDFFGATQSL